ncbi:hypothetical protein ACFQ4H_34905, partial [Micromonospora sonneratiae]
GVCAPFSGVETSTGAGDVSGVRLPAAGRSRRPLLVAMFAPTAAGLSVLVPVGVAFVEVPAFMEAFVFGLVSVLKAETPWVLVAGAP